jgi:hypothetical protein
LSSPDLDRAVLAAVVQKLTAAGQPLDGVAGA